MAPASAYQLYAWLLTIASECPGGLVIDSAPTLAKLAGLSLDDMVTARDVLEKCALVVTDVEGEDDTSDGFYVIRPVVQQAGQMKPIEDVAFAIERGRVVGSQWRPLVIRPPSSLPMALRVSSLPPPQLPTFIVTGKPKKKMPPMRTWKAEILFRFDHARYDKDRFKIVVEVWKLRFPEGPYLSKLVKALHRYGGGREVLKLLAPSTPTDPLAWLEARAKALGMPSWGTSGKSR